MLLGEKGRVGIKVSSTRDMSKYLYKPYTCANLDNLTQKFPSSNEIAKIVVLNRMNLSQALSTRSLLNNSHIHELTLCRPFSELSSSILI